MKIITDEQQLHRVHLADFRPAVGGFLSYQEAYLYALNNVSVRPGEDKEKKIKKSISAYKRVRVVPARKELA